MNKKLREKVLLTEKEKRDIFKSYPCLDPSFESDYGSEVSLLLEKQAEKAIKLAHKGEV